MLRTLQPAEFEVVKRLVRTPDGRAFLALMTAELRAIESKLIDAPRDQVEKMQGRGQQARELEKLLNDAQQQQPT